MAQWPGWSEHSTLVLPLDEAAPTTPMDVDGRQFQPKDELHITLVGDELGRELQAVLGDRIETATRPAFEALDWSFDWTGQRVVIEKPGQTDSGEQGTVASVVELVDLPALDFFYQWLGELLGRQLAVPPAHVTLYTHARAKGIGIPDHRKLRAWAVRELEMLPVETDVIPTPPRAPLPAPLSR